MAKATSVGELVAYLTEGSTHEWKQIGDKKQFFEWFVRLCHWPPNVFAVTAAILHESGIYRVTPEPGRSSVARREAVAWTGFLFDSVRISEQPWDPASDDPCCQFTGGTVPPQGLLALGEKLWQTFGLPVASDDQAALAKHRQDILYLHYLADEACCGIGTPRLFRDWEPSAHGTRASDPHWPSLSHDQMDTSVARLSAAGTLSCFEPLKIRVLPKKHTPQVGITLRSVSLWVGAVRGEVKVNWYTPALASPVVDSGEPTSNDVRASGESSKPASTSEATRQIEHDALGMVRRSIPTGGDVSTVVALWKDPRTGTRELSMNQNADALVLSLATNTVKEFTFDGRDDGENAGVLTFAGVNEIRLTDS